MELRFIARNYGGTTMTKTMPAKMWAALALSAAMILSGCHKGPQGVKNADGSITNPDGSVTYPAGTKPAMATRNPDGSVTNPDGSVTYPAGSTKAQQEAANNPGNAAKAAAAAPERSSAPARSSRPASSASRTSTSRTVPAGTTVPVTMSETLSAKNNNVGDSFSGVLSAPLTTEGGGAVFERGTRVTGQVVSSKGRGRFKGAGDLGIELTSIGGMSVSTTEYAVVVKGKGKRTATMAGGGAGLGALIGGLAGGGKGALIGGLAGAGAGTAGAAYTGNKEVTIPAESHVTFKLTAPLHVQ